MTKWVLSAVIKKIVRQGRGRIISVTRIFPDDWEYVQLEVVSTSKDSITVRFSKVK